MKRILGILGLVLCWVVPAQAAYINWTGENVLSASAGNAATACTANGFFSHCYASFADGVVQSAIFRAVVPQDMPYASNAPRLKCSVTGYTTTGGAGNAHFSYRAEVFPTGAEATPTANGNSSSAFSVAVGGANVMGSGTCADYTVLYDQNSNGSCTTNATCVGVPLQVMVVRSGDQGDDTISGDFRLVQLTCEY